MIEKILSGIKSLYVNVKLFGIKKGIKLPLWINWRVKVNLGKKINIKLKNVAPKNICIGWGGSQHISPNSQSYFIVADNSTIIFEKSIFIAQGCSIRTNPNSILKFGKSFYANRNFEVNSTKEVIFGDNVLIGWNVVVQDGNGHKIIYEDGKSSEKGIQIGNEVWIAAHNFIMGGTSLGSNSVVALDSLVNKTFSPDSLIGGVPAKRIKTIKSWKN